MDKIEWCLEQKKGIELIEPNKNLKEAYLKKAEEALETITTSKSRDWKLIASYYTIYQGLYSLLMEIGIKCEIHTCTIEFAKKLLTKHFSAQELALIDRSFDARVDSQYYIDREVPEQKYKHIIKQTPKFLVTCKNISLEEKEIQHIREKLIAIQKRSENIT